MSKGGSTKVQETAQQRALADYAMAQMKDYEKRWLPVQENLAAQIKEMGAADSRVRTHAAGRSTTDTAMQFDRAGGALQKQLADSGVNLGSSRSKLALAGLNDDAAKSKGLGITLADQQIDDAYTQGLGAIAAAGRGERQAVGNSLAQQAETSARRAVTDAEMALAERAGYGKVAGQAIGLASQQYLKDLGSGGGEGPVGGYLTANNTGGSTGYPGTVGGYTLPGSGLQR